MRGQNSDRMITGQKVAAMPDQPKMTNQKMVRSGVESATPRATPRPTTARPRVALRDRPSSSASPSSGCRTFWYQSRTAALPATTSRESTVDMIAESTIAM